MDRKKKAIIYGNCHTSVIKAYLESCGLFCEDYYFYDIPQIQNIKNPDYFTPSIFKDCDLFIHQSIRLENRYGPEFASENIIKLLKPDCKIVSIPNVYHLPICFFPQYYEEKELRINNKTFFFRDRIIDDGIRYGKTVKEIKEDYMSDNYYQSGEILRMYDTFLEKVRKREKDWDIKVSDYIEKETSQIQLFYDPNHPCNCFLKYVSLEILKILYPNEKSHKLDIANTEIFILDTYEMPICQSVASTFGFPKSTIYRKCGRKVLHKNMNIDNYIKQYFSMCWIVNDFSFRIRVKSFLQWFSMKILDVPYLFVKAKNKIKRMAKQLTIREKFRNSTKK